MAVFYKEEKVDRATKSDNNTSNIMIPINIEFEEQKRKNQKPIQLIVEVEEHKPEPIQIPIVFDRE